MREMSWTEKSRTRVKRESILPPQVLKRATRRIPFSKSVWLTLTPFNLSPLSVHPKHRGIWQLLFFASVGWGGFRFDVRGRRGALSFANLGSISLSGGGGASLGLGEFYVVG